MPSVATLPVRQILKNEVDTWRLAEQMLALYRDAAHRATGDAECRQIVRMQEVVKGVMEHVCEVVEGVETESV